MIPKQAALASATLGEMLEELLEVLLIGFDRLGSMTNAGTDNGLLAVSPIRRTSSTCFTMLQTAV